MIKVLRFFNNLNLMIGKFVSFLIWIGIVVLCYEVIARYVFGQPTIWAHGYTQRIFGSYFVLVGSYTLFQKEHVRVDILLHPAKPRMNALADLLNCSFLIIWGSVLTVEGWAFFLDAWTFNELDDSALGHPMWPPKFALFVGCFLITLRGIFEAIDALFKLIVPDFDFNGAIR